MRKNAALTRGVGAFGKRSAGLERSRNGKRGKKCRDTAMGTARVFPAALYRNLHETSARNILKKELWRLAESNNS